MKYDSLHEAISTVLSTKTEASDYVLEGLYSDYHSKKPGVKDGMPYEYSSNRWHPDEIPKHLDKEKIMKRFQDEDASNERVKNAWNRIASTPIAHKY